MAGALPQTPQGELTHTLAGFKGPTSRREEGRGTREKEEREGEGKQEKAGERMVGANI